ncbi:hypothetical protein U1Q18_022974 [Sarracenia purpurea var. burkii]
MTPSHDERPEQNPRADWGPGARCVQSESRSQVKVEVARYWDGGYNAFRKKAQAMFPSIDFSIIQPDEEDAASYAEGDETAHGPAEGTLLESVPPEPNLPR